MPVHVSPLWARTAPLPTPTPSSYLLQTAKEVARWETAESMKHIETTKQFIWPQKMFMDSTFHWFTNLGFAIIAAHILHIVSLQTLCSTGHLDRSRWPRAYLNHEYNMFKPTKNRNIWSFISQYLSLCVYICLSVCSENNSKRYEWIQFWYTYLHTLF